MEDRSVAHTEGVSDSAPCHGARVPVPYPEQGSRSRPATARLGIDKAILIHSGAPLRHTGYLADVDLYDGSRDQRQQDSKSKYYKANEQGEMQKYLSYILH